MKISEIQIEPIKPKGGLVAFASFVFEDALYCGSVAIFTRPKGGYRLVYPNKQVAGRPLDMYHPISGAVGKLIEHVVITKYEEVVTNAWNRHSNTNTLWS
jgi:DNA-binding cell septation regulator SpoVG